MTKRYLAIFTAISTLMGFAPYSAKDANAFALIHVAGTGDFKTAGIALAMCAVTPAIVLFPLCFLDEKSSRSTEVSEATLMDNGYSGAQARQILMDHQAVMDALKFRGLAISSDNNETLLSLEKTIREIVPEVSDEYIQFATNLAGVR